jgi:hypothetical protein
MTQFAGGVVATVAQSLAMVPLEVVRQRQQVQTNTSGAYQVSPRFPSFPYLKVRALEDDMPQPNP